MSQLVAQLGFGVTNSTSGCVTAKAWEWWMKVQMTACPGLQAYLALALSLSRSLCPVAPVF